ncbi:MAG TPA: single-stranded DNA-binding protein [Bacillales bacterium]
MINRTVLVGRLTKDPELRYTPNGVAVANFTLACDRPFTNQQGEREADFIRCQVWKKSAESAANYLHKGSLAGVDGRIQTRSYDKDDGQRVFITEVVADRVQFLEPKRSQAPVQDSAGGKDDDPFAGNGKPIDISDDDLPF